jgi:hypothetical protein
MDVRFRWSPDSSVIRSLRSSRLLKKSLRFRNKERRRDFLLPATACFRGFGLT